MADRAVWDDLTWKSEAWEWARLFYFGGRERKENYWPPLQPPPKEVLPEFPVEVLPDFVRQWVDDVSRANQTPTDLAAMLAIAAGSAAIGNRCRITAREGWTEPTSLFTAVMCESGTRQSAVFKEALRPLHEWEAQLRRTGGVSPPLHPSDDSAAGRRRYGEAPATLSRFLGESSDRMLLASLVEQGATGILSPRGGILRQLAGRNTVALREEMRIMETAYDGDSLVYQQTPRRFLQIDNPAVACGLSIEPSLLEGMAKKTKFAGNSLLDRFLFAVPASRVGKRQIGPAAISKQALGCYRASIRNLVTIENDLELTLSPEAEVMQRAWEAEIESQLDGGGSLEEIRDWGMRLPGATLRIAAILHLMECGDMPTVDDKTMSAAIAIGRYLIPHARSAFERMGVIPPRPETEFEYLIRWMKRHGVRTVSARDAHQEMKKRFSDHGVRVALAGLARRGYLRPVKLESGKGRPPSATYDVNPMLFGEDPNAPVAAPESSAASAAPPVDALEKWIYGPFRQFHAYQASLAEKNGAAVHESPETLEKAGAISPASTG